MILRTAVCAGDQLFPCLTWLQGKGGFWRKVKAFKLNVERAAFATKEYYVITSGANNDQQQLFSPGMDSATMTGHSSLLSTGSTDNDGVA